MKVELHRVEHTVSARAHLARRELVLVAPVSGQLVLLAENGQRVRAGTVLAEVANPRARAAVESQLAQAEARLRQFEAESAPTAVAREARLREGASRLEQLVAEWRRATPHQRLALEEELGDLLAAQAGERAAGEELVADHDRLLGEVTRLREQRGLTVAALASPWPGVVDLALDGLEGALRWDRLHSLTARAVFTMAPSPTLVRHGQQVEAGQQLFKLVDMAEVSLLLGLPESEATGLRAGMPVGVRAPAVDQHTRAGLVTAVRPGNPPGQVLVQVTLSQGVEELGTRRQLEATLVKAVHEGFRVPSSSLLRRGDELGVYVSHRMLARFRPVRQVATDGQWVLVTGLSPGEEVVKTPRWVREGRRVR
jgi:multidrug resistance efflux pump